MRKKLKRYKFVCVATFTPEFLKEFKHQRKTMQRTYYYKAKLKQAAIDKLKKNRDIYDGCVVSWLWKWKVTVSEVDD